MQHPESTIKQPEHPSQAEGEREEDIGTPREEARRDPERERPSQAEGERSVGGKPAAREPAGP